jgi:hypothetical protein
MMPGGYYDSYQRPQDNYYGGGSTSRGTGGGYTMGKGSSTPAPKVSSPMESAQAQDWLAQQEYNRQQAAAKTAADKAAADLAAQKTKTAGDINTQYTAGQAYGSSHLADLGFADTYGLMDRYNTALNNAKAGVPDTATNVASYFNPQSYWDTAVNEATGAQRNKLNTEYTNTFTPGWQKADQYGFADTADDAILNAIMGEQRTSTQDTLKANLARGQMSQGAYDYAINQMGNQANVGMSNLQNIGGGVLGKYREGLGNTANQYGDRITGYQLGQNVNLGDLTGQLGTQRGGYQTGMRGDILSALGDTKLFDLEKLISSAGVAQGAQNTPLATAFNNQQAAVDPNRTTGTTGIF